VLARCSDNRFRLPRVTDVPSATVRCATGGANLIDRTPEIGFTTSANKYRGTLTRIGDGDRLADAAASSGNERDFAG
jgi:hypothetical protein